MQSMPPTEVKAPEGAAVEVGVVVVEGVAVTIPIKIKPHLIKTKTNLNGQLQSILMVPQPMHVLTIILMVEKLFIVQIH